MSYTIDGGWGICLRKWKPGKEVALMMNNGRLYIMQCVITLFFARGPRRPRYNGVAVYNLFYYFLCLLYVFLFKFTCNVSSDKTISMTYNAGTLTFIWCWPSDDLDLQMTLKNMTHFYKGKNVTILLWKPWRLSLTFRHNPLRLNERTKQKYNSVPSSTLQNYTEV